ncbi:acetate--CoA ligase family protein, partial [Candidatus Aerophobetes bacterium]|nr:acetate--CoA ligase family protein [Candidatus Aerophobetes bacterium]
RRGRVPRYLLTKERRYGKFLRREKLLENFFKPDAVAVVGASIKHMKLGNQILENLLKDGFPGRIFPINAKADSTTRIMGIKAYPSLVEVPQPIDLAIVVVPSRGVLSVIQDCGAKGIDSVVIISAGFKEVDEEGAKLESELLRLSKNLGIHILGPNVLGIIDAHHHLNASFAPASPSPGNIAFLSQSGALGCVILDKAEGEGIGLSKFISLGNKVDLDEVDFLAMLKDDAQTDVILGYLEGIKRGRDFISVAKEVTSQKPVVMIKAGRSDQGKRAASSHTGSLAGQDEAYDVAFQASGIIRANSLREAIDLARGFSSQPIPQGKRVLLLTNGGGAGIMATDACEQFSLELANLEDETKERLKEKLPHDSSVANPIDILGDAKSDRYEIALEAILTDPNVDGVIVLLTPQSGSDEDETARLIIKISPGTKKTILTCFMGQKKVKGAIKILQNHGIPNYADPEDAVRVFEAMFRYGEWLKRPKEAVKTFPVSKSRVDHILNESIKEGYLEIGGERALQIMKAYGIPTVENYLVRELHEALDVAESLHSSLAMKIESPAILHKSDTGGVLLNLKLADVETSFYQLMERTKRIVQANRIRGISIQPMVKEGKEVLIGVSWDDVFGHLIKFGLGGKYVEIYRDVSTKLVPLTPSMTEEMIGETKVISRLLKGVREESPSDVPEVEEALLRFSQLVCDFPRILEIEANPLVVWKKGAMVVDARLRLKNGCS